MSRWSEDAICAWGIETFGYTQDQYALVFRAIDELKELMAAVEMNDPIAARAEIADVVIVLTQACNRLGGSLQEEIDDKMDINSMRTWTKTGDGVGQHREV